MPFAVGGCLFSALAQCPDLREFRFSICNHISTNIARMSLFFFNQSDTSLISYNNVKRKILRTYHYSQIVICTAQSFLSFFFVILHNHSSKLAFNNTIANNIFVFLAPLSSSTARDIPNKNKLN